MPRQPRPTTQNPLNPRRRFSSASSACSGLIVVVLVSACTPKTVPAPVVTAPKFPEFIQPAVPPAFDGSPLAMAQSRGWTFLQAGDMHSAEREFSTALTAAPAFYPAESGLGYVSLANKDARAAVTHFDRALEREQNDVSALVGRGQALLTLNRSEDALAAFRAAVTLDPSLTEIRQRVEVLAFRGVEQGIAHARAAARAGRADEAIQAYTTAIAASPDSPFLYRELAAVERQKGDTAAALEHYRKAAALDPMDARSVGQIGELLEAEGDLAGATKAYTDALAIEPNAEVEKRLDVLREKSAFAALPAEYRAIDQAPQITRADLAALIGIRLAPLVTGTRSRDAALITDVRGNWASIWIMAVARGGIMEPFANHQFQPRSAVRRTDLAQAAARLLSRIAAQHRDQPRTWESARLQFPDLSPGHLAYPAASMAIAAGVMKTGPGDAFQPSRVVTGAEAIDAIDKLQALAGLPSTKR
jgi:Flp pilus assembly protein TadD